jgi:hypothetical protein
VQQNHSPHFVRKNLKSDIVHFASTDGPLPLPWQHEDATSSDILVDVTAEQAVQYCTAFGLAKKFRKFIFGNPPQGSGLPLRAPVLDMRPGHWKGIQIKLNYISAMEWKRSRPRIRKGWQGTNRTIAVFGSLQSDYAEALPHTRDVTED